MSNTFNRRYAALNPASEMSISSRQMPRVCSSPDCRATTRRRARSANSVVGAEVRAGPGVERLGLRQRQGRGVDALLEDLLDQHAELGAPVADVVLRDHLVADAGITRWKQSPMIVERRCPTCICLATFGAE